MGVSLPKMVAIPLASPEMATFYQLPILTGNLSVTIGPIIINSMRLKLLIFLV
jgi:hypothetical protein